MSWFRTILPAIVLHDRIATGRALHATPFSLARVTGPALAGLPIANGVRWAASCLPFIGVAMGVLPRSVIGARAARARRGGGVPRLIASVQGILSRRWMRTRGPVRVDRA